MSKDNEMSEREAAELDAAFSAGVREALQRGTALLMTRGEIKGQPIWAAFYPPATATAVTVVAWARAKHLKPADGDLFIDVEKVRQAAQDLGVG